MSGLGVVEWLRPLVETTKSWDFIVVWKYGDDPSRFIEWMGCCCRGGSCSGNNEKVKPKEEMGEQYPICRDTHFKHPITTTACEALSKLPFAISLFSGVHGEVAISQQPKWLTQEDLIGTQVLIPIVGGLIELFTAKLIPKDKNIIEYITAHCCVSLKQEAISSLGYSSLNFNEHLQSEEQCSQKWPPHTSTLTSVHLPASNCMSHPSIEGTSSGSDPSNEHPSFDSKTHHEYLKKSVKISPMPKTKMPKYNEASGKQLGGLSSHYGKRQKDKAKLVRKPQKEGCVAKNLVTERKRRNKIKNGLFTLRSLVPKITKMDRAAILSDAIDYIKELEGQVKELKDELMALEEEEFENSTTQLKILNGKEQGGTRSLPLTELNQISSNSNKTRQMKVQVEVNHIGSTDFLIKLYCEQKPGGFSRLMEAINSFGLQMTNVNVITLDGKVMNILTVKATKQDIHPTPLKEYLIEQIGR